MKPPKGVRNFRGAEEPLLLHPALETNVSTQIRTQLLPPRCTSKVSPPVKEKQRTAKGGTKPYHCLMVPEVTIDLKQEFQVGTEHRGPPAQCKPEPLLSTHPPKHVT